MTQSSLTKRLQLLKDDHGHALFVRGVHGATLTEQGEVLRRHAERIESELLQSREAMAALGGEGLTVLRIGAGPLCHLRYLADALLALRFAHPETTVEVVTGLYRETMPRLPGRTLDIVFGADEGTPVHLKLIFERLTSVEQGVALRQGHPILTGRPLVASVLQDLDWVIHGDHPEDSVLVDAFFAREGRTSPDVSLLTQSFTLGLQNRGQKQLRNDGSASSGLKTFGRKHCLQPHRTGDCLPARGCLPAPINPRVPGRQSTARCSPRKYRIDRAAPRNATDKLT